MTEMDGIDTEVDTLVALNIFDLDQLAKEYAQIVTARALVTAYTTGDVDALDEAAAKAELKKGITVIGLLLDWIKSNYTKKYIQV